MSPILERSVPEPSAGTRLDRFLAEAQKDLSRSRLQALIRAGRVRVNGRPARAAHRLRAGDRIAVDVPEPRTVDLVPEDLPLAIVHEDPDLLVVDKPPGMVVHPGAGVTRGTLVHALLHHVPSIAGVGGAGRPGIVHRLDKDTSGLLAVAKTERAHRSLVEQLRARTASRVYAALVWGSPPEKGELDAPIARDPRHRKRMAVVRTGGRPSLTRWRVEERLGPASLLEVRLETGRTHQIRVHLAHLGFPVVGDPLYGGTSRSWARRYGGVHGPACALLDRQPRQALHASRLAVTHPVTGARLEWASPLPADFVQALDTLRSDPSRPV